MKVWYAGFISWLGILTAATLTLAPMCTASAAPKPTSTPVASSASKKPITIGVIVPFTGATGQGGIDHRKGIETYWAGKGNRVAGRKVELFFEDSEGKAEIGLAKGKKLVIEKQAHILMGITFTPVAYALQPFVAEVKVPLLVSNYAAADALTKQNASPFVFRTAPSTNVHGTTMADWAYQRGYRTMTLLSSDYSAGHEGSGSLARRFIQLGGKIIQEIYAPMGTMDYSPYIAQLDRKVDVIGGITTNTDGMALLRDYAAAGLQGKIPLMADSTTNEEYLDSTGDSGVGNISFMAWVPSVDTPESKKFVNMWIQKHGDRPTYPMEAGYLSSRIVYEAIEAIKGNVEDKNQLLAALRKTDIPDSTRGRLRFDKYGGLIENYVVIQVAKGSPWKKHPWYNKVLHTYPSIDQFWPWKDTDFLSWPQYKDLKGTWVERSKKGLWR